MMATGTPRVGPTIHIASGAGRWAYCQHRYRRSLFQKTLIKIAVMTEEMWVGEERGW